LALLQGLPEREQRGLEWRQIVFDRPPNDRSVDALVVVPQNVADAGNILPADILVLRFLVAAEMTAGFRNDLDATLDCRAQQPRALVVAKGFSGKRLFDSTMLSSMSWMRSKGERIAI
jgi:hypothetical protein